MKIPSIYLVLGAALSLPIFADQGLPGTMIRDANDLGTVTYSEWVDGAEKDIVNLNSNGVAQPLHYLWNKTKLTDGSMLYYGDSRAPGIRYLRIAFKNPVAIGSILARGGGSVSVLKPGVSHADLTDDSQWIPAQRLKAGEVSDAEAGPDEVVVWTLPAAVTTQAIRFTHTSQPSDQRYSGSLGGIAIFPERLANVAPQAIVTASAAEEDASRLNDGIAHHWSGWSNLGSVKGATRARTVAEAPEWATLIWPKPVTLQGLGLVDNLWGSVEIQALRADRSPGEANDADWKAVQTLSGVKPQYPCQLDLIPISFETPVVTRALRIRFTSAFDETGVHPHLVGKSMDGKRVMLGQALALEPLDGAALQTAVIPKAGEQAHAPIPIRFKLPEEGEVTLVIDDASGKRVRNLVSQTPFPKGDNVVWWDGTDDLGRDPEAAAHGIYSIPSELVAPGAYSVRGLWHKPLDLHYEMVVYAPGDPPWQTVDGSGAWMTTHTPGSCTLFVPGDKAPGGQPLVYLGAYVSEGGSALSWLNLDGKKVGGRGWIGGAWTGAQYLASDSGAHAEPGVYAYVGSVFVGNKRYGVNGKAEYRLTKLTAKGDRPVLTPNYLGDPLPEGKNGARVDNSRLLGGLAVHDGLLVISQTALDQIIFIDAKQGKMLATAPLPSPRGLAFDSEGRLLALSGKSLLRFTLGGAPATLPAPETLAHFEDPWGITVDAAGKIYVSDQGGSNQVKIFSPQGTPVATIGKPGAPKAGPYDPLHMNNPAGLTVDSNGRLWVAENDFHPKRLSIWNPDGTLWKAFYGGPTYGGGGIVDPKDKTKFLFDGMEFHLDWKKGTYDLSRVYYRPGPDDLPLAFRDAPPETPVYFNGQRYLSDVNNSGATGPNNTIFLFLDNGDTAVPVAAAGNAHSWDVLKGDAFKSRWPQGIAPDADAFKFPAFFIWSDLNGDGKPQPDEVTILPGFGGGISIGEDGSFIAATSGTSRDAVQAVRYKPIRFAEKGAPVYDIAAPEVLAPAQFPAADGGGQILVGTDGWLVMTTPPPPFSKLGIGGARNGKPAWSYPSLWPGLHPSHSAPPPDRPGMLIGTTRLLGNLVTPGNSEAGPLFFINSNQGDIDSFTQDGLFVAQLFQDVRQGKLWEMPVAQQNMLLNDITLHDENFFPAVSQSPDGTIYIMSGANMGIVRVDNLDTVRRIPPATIQVTADDLKRANDFVVAREAERQAARGSSLLAVALRTAPPALDGKLEDWGDAQWVPIDRRGVAAYFDARTRPYDVSGAVAVAGGKLFAAWKTGDPKLLENAGDVPNGLFKTGGALDLMIGSDPNAKPDRAGAVSGDERLLVARVGGKTQALLYRPVVQGTAEKDKVPFTAPWHGITIDRVDDVSGQVQFAADGSGNYEIAVPLSVLGLKPQPGMRIKGDMGVLRGNGKQTTQRVYWTNKATAIVSDVPSEAELTPRLWGTWEFEAR